MTVTPRQKRPKLARAEPIRRVSALFGAAPDNEGERSSDSGGETPFTGSDVIARSVELGYQLVDDYVRQGQRVARRLSGQNLSPQALAGDAEALASRMTQHATQIARLWLDAFQLAGAGVPARGQTPAPEHRPPASGPARAGDPASVRIEIVASTPTAVALELRPEARTQPLTVHALRGAGEDQPRITAVDYRPATATTPAALRISIPSGHPRGVYSGVLVDEATNRAVGTLTVEILPE